MCAIIWPTALLPALCYAALLAAAAMIYPKSEYAAEDLAGALLLLMIVNIRNAWDLMLSMVRHQAQAPLSKLNAGRARL